MPRPATCGGLARGSAAPLRSPLRPSRARVLRLEREDDLRTGVRDAFVGPLDHVGVRQPDPFVAAADPHVAIGRLPENVEPPAACRRLPHPRLVVLVERLRRLGVRPHEAPIRQVTVGDEELEPGECLGQLGKPCAGHGDLEILVFSSSSPRKRSIAQPAATCHGACTCASSAAAAGTPCVPEADVGLERAQSCSVFELHGPILATRAQLTHRTTKGRLSPTLRLQPVFHRPCFQREDPEGAGLRGDETGRWVAQVSARVACAVVTLSSDPQKPYRSSLKGSASLW